jgi:ribonuclease BN (tRNA processing enzyme)
VRLTVLGTSAAYPDAGRAASGYLLEHDGFRVALDFGTGALSNLQRQIRHGDLDAILLSHEHVDHCADIHPLFMARRFTEERLPPLPVIGPRGAFERIAALEPEDDGKEMRGYFDVRHNDPGSSFEIGPFDVHTRLLPHWVPDSGLRIEANGSVVAYTGDTGPSAEIEALAASADVLVTEASWQDSGAERPPFHLTARQSGEHAARAGVKRLVLSHFWPGADRDLSREQAAEAFDGDIVLADEGLTLEVEG